MDMYIHISATETHRAFSGEACQCSFVLLCPTCLRLLSTGPWSPGSWGACSGSVLVLRLGMESCFRDPTPSLPLLPAVTRCYPRPLKSDQKQHLKKNTQKCTKYAKRLSSWGPEGVENQYETDFLRKYAMCV